MKRMYEEQKFLEGMAEKWMEGFQKASEHICNLRTLVFEEFSGVPDQYFSQGYRSKFSKLEDRKEVRDHMDDIIVEINKALINLEAIVKTKLAYEEGELCTLKVKEPKE